MRRSARWTLSAIFACLFVSGAAGLIYEVLWARYLALFLGSTGRAHVVVLATFMGGLALGSHVLGRLADRVRSPLKLYAFLELGIGVCALLFDNVFSAGRALFLQIVGHTGLSGAGLTGAQFAASVLCVLLPTFLMGGTTPSVSRYLIRTQESFGPRLSRLYFFNSLGAVAGCLLAGFWLIRYYGMAFSMVVGALLNILCGVAALGLAAAERDSQAAEAPSPGPAPQATAPDAAQGPLPGRRWLRIALWSAVILSGAAAMLYEVAWIRMLALVLGSSTYSFSLMLATFILGLSIGAYLLSLRRRTGGFDAVFGWTEVAVGLSVLLTLPFYTRLPYVFNHLACSLTREPETYPFYEAVKFILCSLVMIVPTILQGITLPAATRALTAELGGLGRRVGLIWAVNTLGTLAGSVFAGFVGLPWLGIKGTLELAVALNLVTGLAVLFGAAPTPANRRLRAGMAVAAVAGIGAYRFLMPEWNYPVLESGHFRARERIVDVRGSMQEAAARKYLYYRDGVDASVSVREVTGVETGRVLVINGKADGSTFRDMATQKLLGHLPMLAAPRPRKVLVVGIGTGSTIGSVLAYPEVECVDAVEISDDVVKASRYFADINGRYWEDPRVRIHREDAKTFLQVSREKYDLIISEPSNPWMAGVAGVFTHEYFRICREHLTDRGLVCQWVQAYELEELSYLMVMETLTEVFPCYTVWNSLGTDTMILASAAPFRMDFQRLNACMASDTVQRDLAQVDIHSPVTVLALQMLDCAAAPSSAAWTGARHSDFFPVLEYVAPRGFFLGANAAGVWNHMDHRLRSSASAGLWLNAYLAQYPLQEKDLEDCSRFWARHPPMTSRLVRGLAAERVRRYPSSPAAWEALGRNTQASYEGMNRDLQAALEGGVALSYEALRRRCVLALLDYRDTRNFLSEARAPETLLALIDQLQGRFPDRKDYLLDEMRGELLIDAGRPADAAAVLRRAIETARTTGVARLDVDTTAFLLCRALVQSGDLAGARTVFGQFFQGRESASLGIRIAGAFLNAGVEF